MKPTLSTKITTLILSIGLLMPQIGLAAEFNPNYIISDEELQDASTMRRNDIQVFLDDKGGYIRDKYFEDEEGKDRKAADIIYRAAQEYQINPKYLLVKLQKEMSLITHKNPTERQLDFATGYGVCDSCYFNDPKVQKNKGFGKQVSAAAGIMRWYYDNLDKSYVKKKGQTYTIDGQTVRPTSYATAFLYTYTPHLQGNKNFWKLWNQWFTQSYPDGSLVKGTSGSTVYLLQNGKKRAFKNQTALITRFDPKMIISIPDGELSSYETGAPISFPNYAILKEGSTYYLLDHDTIRPFESAAVFRTFGYHPDEVITVSSSDLRDYTIGKTISAKTSSLQGEVYRLTTTGALYYIKDGVYHPIFDKRIVAANYPNATIQDVTTKAFGALEDGLPIKLKDGTLFGIDGSRAIYVVEHGKRRPIRSGDIFEELGFKWSNIVWVSEEAGILHPLGSPMYGKPSAGDTSTEEPTIIAKDTTAEKTAKQKRDEQIAALMVRTPANKLSYTGPQFETEVDGYAVVDATTGELLAGKNTDTIRPMASLTKVMSGYRIIKEELPMNRLATYDPHKDQAEYHYYKIAAGERVRNKHLLDAMLVSSLNTPAKMLARQADGNEAGLVARMNQQAKEWGLEKTAFKDPHGLSEYNETTVTEFAQLFRKSLEQPTLASYLGKTYYEYKEVIDKDGYRTHSDIHSNKLHRRTDLPFEIVASKTGYLYEAGSCLAMLVERPTDGKQFIVVTMANPDKNNRFQAPADLAAWAVEKF